MQRCYSCLTLIILFVSNDYAMGSFEVMTEEQCHQLMEESCNASRILEINACNNQCADCSCSKECTVSMNCCFDEMYSNERAEADDLTCTPSVVGNKYREDKFGLYMITTCPTNTSEINQCGEETLTFWGSLSPVYSPERKLIYKNARCAQCHHAEDVVNFETMLQCQIHTNGIGAKSLDEVMTRVKMNFDDQQFCFVQFELPKQTLHIPRRVLQCFPRIINTCNGSDSPPELVNICEKGPIMPVMSVDYPRVIWYRNLFCRFCHRDQNLCQHPKHAFMYNSKYYNQFESAGSFTVMVAGKKSTEMSMPVAARGAYLRRVCTQWGIDKVCRLVFCPSTRLVKPDGTCGPPFLDLKVSKFKIHLHFMLTPYIHEHLFLDVIRKLDGSGKQFPVNFNSPWAENWTVIPVVFYYSKNGKVDNFMYVLLRKNNRKSYAEVLSDTERLLNIQWHIHADNKTFVVTQTFSRFFDFVPITESSNAGSSDVIPVDIASITPHESAILSQYSVEIKAFSTYVLGEINGKHNAHILLQNGPEDYVNHVYEVVIGAYNNTQSHLRLGQTWTPIETLQTSGILDETQYRPFWITWDKTLAIGQGTGIDISNIILSTRLNFRINAMRISYGYGSDGYFRFPDKMESVSIPQTTTSGVQGKPSSKKDELERPYIVIGLATSTGCLGAMLLLTLLCVYLLWKKRKASGIDGELYVGLRRGEQNEEHYAAVSV